ncbi:MAG: TauD/TfdA family dioxygenase [Gammaproteobacteria bacterium]|nr:TauD/TfdA family dioxygenase [Gammaproteobacteria bacterium]MDP6695246.1 TauD/TfdA family dioxygenase [Gammaproteobacteria bacterium]
MNTAGFEIRPMSGALGAEITGLDLAQPMDDETFAGFCDAWHRYQVLFFRDQELTPEQHIALGKRFGELDISRFIPTVEGYPEIRLQDMSVGGNIPGDVDWHHDNSFMEVPQKCSFLYAKEVPAAGGDTVWVNTVKVLESLSPPMQKFLEGLTAVHDVIDIMGPALLKQQGPEAWQAARDRTPPVEHPVVRIHPETGEKCLYINPLMTSYIKDLNPDESKNLLVFLIEKMVRPEFMVRFQWTKNSVAFWDNISTIHRGIYADLPDLGEEPRIMHRVAVTETH